MSEIKRYNHTDMTNYYIEVGDTVKGKMITEICINPLGYARYIIGEKSYSHDELLWVMDTKELPSENN